jgi:hypothetical protein
MSDHQGAYEFGMMFRKLAEKPTDDAKEFAQLLWTLSREHDFSDDEMRADEALAKLGLARRGIDPDYPKEGEVWLYGPAKNAQG